MEQKEFEIKIDLCKYLNLKPVFVVRMAPKTWIYELYREGGGFTIIFKKQLYPLYYRDLVSRIKNELGLPVDTPRALEQGTMKRFLDWHEKNVNLKSNSH